MKHNFFIVALLCLTNTACSYNSVQEKVLNTNYKVKSTDKPKRIYVKNKTDIANGIVTITPVISGDFPRYRVDKIEELETEKVVTAGKMVSTITYAYFSYGLTLFAFNNKCKEHGVTCTTTSKNIETKEERDGKINKQLTLLPSEVSVSITTNNGETFTFPMSEQGNVTTSLFELGYPKSLNITTTYKNKTSKTPIDVPKIQLAAMLGGSNTVKLTNEPGSYEPNYTERKIKKPFEVIEATVNENIRQFIASVAKPFISNAPTLPLITKPTLPPTPKLVKSQFETKAEFKIRVQEAIEQRQELIDKLQKKYTAKVNARNSRLKILLTEHTDKTKRLQKQYNNRLTKVKSHLNDERIYQLKLAMQKVLGTPSIKNIKYDAETQTAYAQLSMSNANYVRGIKWKMAPENAKALYLNLTDAELSSEFVIKQVKNKQQISLSRTEVDFANKSFNVDFDNASFEFSDIQVVLSDTMPKWDDAQLISPVQNSKELTHQWQNDVLIDDFQLSAVTYVNQQEAMVGTKAFNDDIPSLLAKTKKAKINKKRWLVAIAIENYQYTDQVSFAKRSAELFVQVAQKKLGIRRENTLSLIDHEATSGAVKDNLKLFLSHIGKDDEVYFYYSGHGIPDPSNNNEPYILPIDKIPSYVSEDKDLQLANIYRQLSQSQAKSIVAFIDSCFSGSTDGKSILKGVASARLVPKSIDLDTRQMAVLSAARKDQFSNMYKERGNRLFSYFVMKALMNDRRNINTLFQDVAVKVKGQSKTLGLLYLQEPALMGNKQISL